MARNNIIHMEHRLSDVDVEVTIEEAATESKEITEAVEATEEAADAAAEGEAIEEEVETVEETSEEVEHAEEMIHRFGYNRVVHACLNRNGFMDTVLARRKVYNVSTESLSKSDEYNLQRIALEGLADVAASIWDWIKKILKSISDFFARMFEAVRVRFGNMDKQYKRLTRLVSERQYDPEKADKSNAKCPTVGKDGLEDVSEALDKYVAKVNYFNKLVNGGMTSAIGAFKYAGKTQYLKSYAVNFDDNKNSGTTSGTTGGTTGGTSGGTTGGNNDDDANDEFIKNIKDARDELKKAKEDYDKKKKDVREDDVKKLNKTNVDKALSMFKTIGNRANEASKDNRSMKTIIDNMNSDLRTQEDRGENSNRNNSKLRKMITILQSGCTVCGILEQGLQWLQGQYLIVASQYVSHCTKS